MGTLDINAASATQALTKAKGNHPPVADIRDLMTFRMARLVAANDRLGQDWTMRHFGLRLNEWRVLGLTCALAPVRFKVIARELLMDKGHLSRIIKQMTNSDLIATRPCPDDQRTVELLLTEPGRNLHRRMLEFSLWRTELVLDVLDREESRELLRLMKKISGPVENWLLEMEKRP